MRMTPGTLASERTREHLVRILSEQVQRTFNVEGPAAGLHLVSEAFGRLDDTILRELAYKYGLTTEFEREPEVGEPQ